MTNRRRRARREDLGLTKAEFAVLRRLDTPEKIQDFLFRLKQNFEPNGDSCRPVRVVLRAKNAHCIEGAMLAAAALWIHGEPPLLMDLRAVHDFDHVVALFRRKGLWGAISKTNGAYLRWRDPIYRSLRELAISYMHEYSNKREYKSLREYSRAVRPAPRRPGGLGQRREGRLGSRRAARRGAPLLAGDARPGAQAHPARPLRAHGRRPRSVPQAEEADQERFFLKKATVRDQASCAASSR